MEGNKIADEIIYRILTDFELFNDVYKEFVEFCRRRLKEIIVEDKFETSKKSLILYIKLNYFLKMFKNFGAPNISGALEKLTRQIQDAAAHKDNTTQRINEFIKSSGIADAVERDLEILKKQLPRRFFDTLKVAQIEKSELHRIEEQLLNLLSISELSLIMPELGNLKNRSVKKTLNKFADYAFSLAQSLNKEIRITVIGDDRRLDYREYGEFLKAFLNLFNNIVLYGIETPAERKEKGKHECAQIKVAITDKKTKLSVIITNDGNGKDAPEVGNIKKTFDLLKANENADDLFFPILNAYSETIALNGIFEISFSADSASIYNIEIPLKQKDIKKIFNIDDIFNPLISTLKNYVESKGYAEISENISDKIEKTTELKLNEISAIINIRGFFKGALIISADKNFMKKLIEQVLIETIENSEYEEYFEDTLAECLNLVIGNSLRKFGDYQNLIIFEPPYTIKATNAIVKHHNSEILNCNMETSEGLLTLSLIYTIID